MNSRAEEKREFFDLEERILPEEALFFGKRLARFGAVGGGGDGSPVSRAMLLAVAAGVSAGGRAVLGLRGLLREPVAVLRRALRGRTWGICESGREAAGGLRPGDCPFPPGNGGS